MVGISNNITIIISPWSKCDSLHIMILNHISNHIKWHISNDIKSYNDIKKKCKWLAYNVKLILIEVAYDSNLNFLILKLSDDSQGQGYEKSGKETITLKQNFHFLDIADVI